jgi:hypothetical protein
MPTSVPYTQKRLLIFTVKRQCQTPFPILHVLSVIHKPELLVPPLLFEICCVSIQFPMYNDEENKNRPTTKNSANNYQPFPDPAAAMRYPMPAVPTLNQSYHLPRSHVS